MVRYDVWQFGIVGPYIFEEERVTFTVNSECYVAMLQILQPIKNAKDF